jgi:hypothetical protein
MSTNVCRKVVSGRQCMVGWDATWTGAGNVPDRWSAGVEPGDGGEVAEGEVLRGSDGAVVHVAGAGRGDQHPERPVPAAGTVEFRHRQLHPGAAVRCAVQADIDLHRRGAGRLPHHGGDAEIRHARRPVVDRARADVRERVAVSPVTVRSHVAAILPKLRVPDRDAAVRLFAG